MKTMVNRNASCSCGQLSVTVTEDPVRVSVCREELVAVPVGAFAEPGFPAPLFSVYEERKHAWVGLPRNIEHSA